MLVAVTPGLLLLDPPPLDEPHAATTADVSTASAATANFLLLQGNVTAPPPLQGCGGLRNTMPGAPGSRLSLLCDAGDGRPRPPANRAPRRRRPATRAVWRARPAARQRQPALARRPGCRWARPAWPRSAP